MSFLSYKSTGHGAHDLGSDPNSTAHQQLGELQK